MNQKYFKFLIGTVLLEEEDIENAKNHLPFQFLIGTVLQRLIKEWDRKVEERFNSL